MDGGDGGDDGGGFFGFDTSLPPAEVLDAPRDEAGDFDLANDETFGGEALETLGGRARPFSRSLTPGFGRRRVRL